MIHKPVHKVKPEFSFASYMSINTDEKRNTEKRILLSMSNKSIKPRNAKLDGASPPAVYDNTSQTSINNQALDIWVVWSDYELSYKNFENFVYNKDDFASMIISSKF